MELETPRGYRLQTPNDGKWKLERESDGFAFDVTNRGFNFIDDQFNHLISQTIEELVESQEKVRILDIAGGVGSYAANDIAERFGNSVEVCNADILSHSWDYRNNLSPIRADATHLPFQESSFDLVYSYSYLPYFKMSNSTEEELEVLREIKSVLKPNRTAILDDLSVSYMSTKEMREVEDVLGVTFTRPKRKLPLSVKLSYFMYKPFQIPKFLVMKKS